ncbi:unnamed protein product [Rotaria sp. Silwood2]|nr:unnamed protein product [Rotaria sp. Silwood2]
MQQSMIHSNMHQQQPALSVQQLSVNVTASLYSSMINPTVSSTPISAHNKRGRNDTSGLSDSNMQVRPQYHQPNLAFNSNNTPNKRIRGFNQQRNDGAYLGRYTQNQPAQLNRNSLGTRDTEKRNNNNQQQPSVATCRFATTRFPFSPFSVIFSQEVREKLVVDDLIKHALAHLNVELKTVAYRRGRAGKDECCILIFVENSESFSFLYDRSNWPTELAGCQFTTKNPSIPPQLALVLPTVSLQVDWDEFVQEVKSNYPGVENIVRLKNKAQQPVRAVKLEFLSPKVRGEILEAGEIGIMHMKYKVVEYFAQANVLICSNYFGIGHFRKNCPQKEESTCKTCGEKCSNLNEYQCSGLLKCIHCGWPHTSNDSKCKVMKDYRAALTRKLLANVVPATVGDTSSERTQLNNQLFSSTTSRLPYSTVDQAMPSNMNDLIGKKLDSMLAKVEEEFNATRRSIGELKDEMSIRYDETRKQGENNGKEI